MPKKKGQTRLLSPKKKLRAGLRAKPLKAGKKPLKAGGKPLKRGAKPLKAGGKAVSGKDKVKKVRWGQQGGQVQKRRALARIPGRVL